MCAEPKDGVLPLIATNDSRERKSVKYTVENVVTGEIVGQGEYEIDPDGILTVENLPEQKDGFYLIRWAAGEETGMNHFVCNIGDGWTWDRYAECMKKAGFYSSFEGF